MSKYSLTKKELNFINDHSKQFGELVARLDKARQFKIGDYLIMYRLNEWDASNKQRTLVVNSYGTPQKFIVVHVDTHNMSYIKKIDSKGKPFGAIFSILGDEDGDYDGSSYGDYELEIDPDYAEAIILDSKDDFDPTQQQRDKQAKFKEITEHNKAAKLKITKISDINTFFKAINVGDFFWQSSTRRWLVKDKKVVKSSSIDTWSSDLRKGGPIAVLTIEDQKGNTKTINAQDFWGKAIYRAQPKSYRELKI